MDVEGYRRYKGLTNRPGENLRDHGLDDLTNAAKDAGGVVASAKAEIERHSGKMVAHPGNHLRRVA